MEDELLIAMELEAILLDGGYEVIGPAATVPAALALLGRERPDAGVLDANLRGEKITPVALVLRAMNIPFLLSSAYEPATLNADAALAGSINLGKPASADRLLITLAALLEA